MSAAQPSLTHVLAYHEISNGRSSDIYCISPETFMRHLWVARYAALQSGQQLHVTFDDGHASHCHWAEPILGSFGLQGHFFVPTSWIGIRKGYATWNDLRQLADEGHRIGSHGATHCFLPGCTPSVLEQELTGSRMLLEDRLGRTVTSISMPGGRWSEEVIQACGAAGYLEVYTSEPGMFRPAETSGRIPMPAVIGRFAVRRKTSLHTVSDYVTGRVFTVNRLQSAYRLRQSAKYMIGDSAYQRLWSSLFRILPG